MRMLLAAVALASTSCAAAHDSVAEANDAASVAAPWRAVDAETGKIRDIEGLEQLARDFPDSGTVRLRMLQPLVEAGEVERVMETLEWLYDRGYVFSDVAQAQIPKLLEGVDPGRIAERLIAEAEVIAASEVIATVPAKAGLLESVLMDVEGDRIAATSVTGRSLWGKDPQDRWAEFPLDNTNNISGIALEYGANQVWVAAGLIDGSEADDTRFSGLIALSFGQGPDFRIAAPEGVSLSDLHGARDGTLYASDPVGGGVYRRIAQSNEIESLVEPGILRSPQGLAPSNDGKRLYVSDYRYGVAIIDLTTRAVSRLSSDIPVILDGVDALFLHGNELVAIQNGTSPMRISAFELSDDGLRVVGRRVLEQAHPDWTEPLSGHIGHGALYYIGNGQWDRYVRGKLVDGKEALPTQIRRLPLDAK